MPEEGEDQYLSCSSKLRWIIRLVGLHVGTMCSSFDDQGILGAGEIPEYAECVPRINETWISEINLRM